MLMLQHEEVPKVSLPDIKWQMTMYPVVVAVAANLSKSYYFRQ